MCMSSVLFTTGLAPNSDGDWVGVGYKAIPNTFILDKSGRVNFSNGRMRRKNWSARWANAFKNHNKFSNLAVDYTTIKSGNGIHYPRAFHIFTKLEDARRYGESTKDIIVKVEYKNVLAAGRNNTSWSAGTSGPCVIAQYMRIVEVVK